MTPIVGADVSALSVYEAHGASYRDDGRPADALAILRARGFNCFRLRLFVAPDRQDIVTNDLDYTLALAKRIKASGAALMLDLHYSDTWADPAKQFKPAAWAALPFDELVSTVQEYTRVVLARFSAEGVSPEYVQMGNEITNGLLWPEGRVEFREAGDTAAWERLSRLLRAAQAGLEAATRESARPKIILHIESTGEPERSQWYLHKALDAGFSFDVIGLSYYPEWHGGRTSLRSTLRTLAQEFKKPLLVVETAYPWKHDGHWADRPNLDWPLTPDGQRQFSLDVTSEVRALPDGLGAGVCWWHPESVSTPGLNAWVGGSCALFDDRGNVLPAASALGAPAQHAAP